MKTLTYLFFATLVLSTTSFAKIAIVTDSGTVDNPSATYVKNLLTTAGIPSTLIAADFAKITPTEMKAALQPHSVVILAGEMLRVGPTVEPVYNAIREFTQAGALLVRAGDTEDRWFFTGDFFGKVAFGFSRLFVDHIDYKRAATPSLLFQNAPATIKQVCTHDVSCDNFTYDRPEDLAFFKPVYGECSGTYCDTSVVEGDWGKGHAVWFAVPFTADEHFADWDQVLVTVIKNAAP